VLGLGAGATFAGASSLPAEQAAEIFFAGLVERAFLVAEIGHDLYSTTSRSSLTMRMYSLSFFQTWPWQSFMGVNKNLSPLI